MASQFKLSPEKKRRIAASKRRAAEADEDYDPKAKAAPKRKVEVKPSGTISAAKPGVRDAIRGGVIDLGSQFGLKPERARYFGDIATDVADIVPGVGETVGTAATAEALQNRVVFDPKIIEIVRKYGIAGALGAGLITQQMADQMRQQETGGSHAL